MKRLLAVATALLLSASAAQAHEVRPAYLQIRVASGEEAEAFFKVPARGPGQKPLLQIVWPDGTISPAGAVGRFEGDAWIERVRLRRPQGWSAGTLRVAGMETALTDVLVRFERADGSSRSGRLTAAAPSFRFDAGPGGLDVAAAYFRLGVEHILLGIDHLLFVLALMILTRGAWPLVKTITAFTAAHSLTLALATLGVVRVPQAPVEASIALSILFVAAEIVRARQGARGLTERAPWIVAFVFGLLHGFGFAGALSEVGLPPQAIPLALLFFNLGVEAGQLLFIGAVLGIVAPLRRIIPPPPAWTHGTWVARAPAYAIGGIAAYWVIARVAAL
jgi:hydrogenase/urease accessory protein HupE